jgi:hypothetical protein
MPRGRPRTKLMTVTDSGYYRITAGPLRRQYAHRAYVNRQMQHSLGRDLRADEQVHHLCRNKKCWPPTDYHLVVLDFAIHTAIDSGRTPQQKRKHREQRHMSEVS